MCQAGRQTANVTFCDSKVHLNMTLEMRMSLYSPLFSTRMPTKCFGEYVSPGAVLVSTISKDCRDSDADLDVDGDDTLEYGRAQYLLQNF